MPLPTPNQGESRSEFMTRCMDNETMKREFQAPEQRLAVCTSQWERKGASAEEIVGLTIESVVHDVNRRHD